VKETLQLDYQTGVDHMEALQERGRNYTAAVLKNDMKQYPGGRDMVFFHLLDLDTMNTGIRIIVRDKNTE
jgi:hypothetical protein